MTMSNVRSTIVGARPSEGSSNSISFGRDISARPIASICCSPPLRVPAGWLRRSANTGKRDRIRSMSSATRARSERR